MKRKLVLVACLGLCLPAGRHAGGQTHVVVPPDAAGAKQHAAWESIPVPPLNAFHPARPKRIELTNGVVILLEEDHELPFVSGSIEMRGGSRDVPADKVGLIGLYGEAWRTSGTAKNPGDALDDLLESKAAKIETGGDIDSTALSWSCLKQDEDQVYALAIDLLEHPVFSKDKLALAQQQAIAGIVRRNDDVEGIAGREAQMLVYGAKSPYAREPEIATVSAITVDDLTAWHRKTVSPNNMIITVEGDFEAAAMETKLRDTFGSMAAAAPWPKPTGAFPGPTPGVYLVDKPDVNQTSIWIVGIGTERSNPDYYALQVMNEIFSGGFGSRLFQDVRTKMGLAYSVGGGYGASYDHPGSFHVVASTKSTTTIEATKEMLKDIGELRTQPFTEDELRSAKDQLLNSFIFKYDTREKVLAAAAQLEFYHYPADLLEQSRAGIERVTIDDLQRVARKYIMPEKLAVLVVGNQAQFGHPLSELGLGPAHPVDVTIPMPAGMRNQMSGGAEQ